LNGIFGWVRMMQSTDMDESTRARALAAIERSARAQSQLIEDLLDLSRIVTGRLRLDVASFDPRTVIEAALDAVRPAATAKGIHLVQELDGGAGGVVGAADRIQQVLWNLVMNAVKFTPT